MTKLRRERLMSEPYYNGKVGKMHRKRKNLNFYCPVCHKFLEPIKRAYDISDDDNSIVKLGASWLFINRQWGIEFCVHPKCKTSINEKNIFKILDTLKIAYKDHLLSIALDTKRKKINQ